MVEVLFGGLGVDTNVIQVDDHKFVKVGHEGVVHQTHEGGRG